MTAISLDRSQRNGRDFVPGARAATPGGIGGIVGATLRVPLLGKVLGANLIIVVGAIVAHVTLPGAPMLLELGSTLALSFSVTAMLVWLALRPLADVELVAQRVSDGDFGARVAHSPLADRDMSKLAATMNRLLDRVAADRARIQYLAGRSVRARDIERESVARELRDSLAQIVSGIALQLAALGKTSEDQRVFEQITKTRQLVDQLAMEMLSVAETLYPGTLGEFGLRNAIDSLARVMTRRGPTTVDVDAASFHTALAPAAAAALYRVADEALRNVTQHANAKHAWVALRTEDGSVCLEIEDDGRGVDMKLNDPMEAGLGLFSAKTVLALVGGDLQISSAPERGTRVVACVPSGTQAARS